MKLKRSKVIEIYQNISKVLGLKGVKLAYAVVKTIKKLEGEFQVLQEIMKPSEEMKLFYIERENLCETYCIKDKVGKSVIENGKYMGLDNCEQFQIKIKALIQKYNADIKVQEEKDKEYQKLLDEEVEVEIYQVNIEDIPNDATVEQMIILILFIKESGSL